MLLPITHMCLLITLLPAYTRRFTKTIRTKATWNRRSRPDWIIHLLANAAPSGVSRSRSTYTKIILHLLTILDF